MNVRKAEERDFAELRELFCLYYRELDCEEQPLHLFDEYLVPDFKAELLDVAVAEEGGALVGFVIFQTDDVVNDWNYKEGQGDLREIYVLPSFRGAQTGRKLADFAESALAASGAEEIYTLPAAQTQGFFAKCGYADSGEFCEELEAAVYTKKLRR